MMPMEGRCSLSIPGWRSQVLPLQGRSATRLVIITTTITPIITEGDTITNAPITTGRMVDTIVPTKSEFRIIVLFQG